MSRYRIYKIADEYGIAHSTAMLIWESSESVDDFIKSIEAFVSGEGFIVID